MRNLRQPVGNASILRIRKLGAFHDKSYLTKEDTTDMSFKRKIIIKDGPILLAEQAADIFVASAKRSIDQRGRFAAILSGGSTPRQMHRLLAEEPYFSKITWKKTHIFWADERCVPENDPQSNYGAAQEDFLNRVPIPEMQVHFMPGRSVPEKGARNYRKTLMDFFNIKDDAFPVFDLIFLGMGTDGHTASLFPGQSSLEEREKTIVAVKGGDPNVARLTMTLPVINHASQIVFLISGKEKAQLLKTIFEDKTMRLPAQKIRPIDGDLIWIADRAAASHLSEDITHGRVDGYTQHGHNQ